MILYFPTWCNYSASALPEETELAENCVFFLLQRWMLICQQTHKKLVTAEPPFIRAKFDRTKQDLGSECVACYRLLPHTHRLPNVAVSKVGVVLCWALSEKSTDSIGGYLTIATNVSCYQTRCPRKYYFQHQRKVRVTHYNSCGAKLFIFPALLPQQARCQNWMNLKWGKRGGLGQVPRSHGFQVKVKVGFLYSATYAAMPWPVALYNLRKWQLIGKSQWCGSAATAHTTAPINHNRPSPISIYEMAPPLRGNTSDYSLGLVLFIDLERMKGWVDLAGWLHTEIKCSLRESNADTSPISVGLTNRARRRVTSLILPTPLPLRHAANRGVSWPPLFGVRGLLAAFDPTFLAIPSSTPLFVTFPGLWFGVI